MKFTLPQKLSLVFSIIFGLLFGLYMLILRAELHSTLEEHSDELGEILAEQLADTARDLILSNDMLSLNVILNQVVAQEKIARATVLDVDSQVIAEAISDRQNISNSELADYQYTAEIALDEAIAGIVQISIIPDPNAVHTSKMLYIFLIILVTGIGFIFAIAYFLLKQFSTPLVEINKALAGQQQLTALPATATDEIVTLYENCESLLTELHTFEAMSLPSQIKNNGHADSASKIIASILVIRVVNINTAIEWLHPATLADLLEEFSAILNEITRMLGGQVMRFNGESAMIVFDARDSLDVHAEQALCCAQLFQLVMQKIADKHKSRAAQALEFRLAIHSGDIFTSCHANTAQQRKPSALGKAIEITYYLCKQANPGELIISEASLSLASSLIDEVLQKGPDQESLRNLQITMPADNMSFMAYILDMDLAAYNLQVRDQLQHILSQLDIEGS